MPSSLPERSGVFLDGGDRFTQFLADLSGHLTQRAENIFLSCHLRLLVGDDVASGAVLRPQGQDVLTTHAGDRSIEHRGACRSDAHSLSNLGSQPRIRRLLHHRQRFSDAFLRDEAEERRLLKLHRESLAQRVVEHRDRPSCWRSRARTIVSLSVSVAGRRLYDRTRDCRCNEDSGADRQPPYAMPREHRPLLHRSAGLEAGRLTIALQALEVRARISLAC